MYIEYIYPFPRPRKNGQLDRILSLLLPAVKIVISSSKTEIYYIHVNNPMKMLF